MKMEVFVRVHIIEIETGPPECLELWNYFGTRLAAKAGREPVFKPRRAMSVLKHPPAPTRSEPSPRMNPEIEADYSDFLRFPKSRPGLWPVACNPALEWYSPVRSEHFPLACGPSPPFGCS
jgi:hypothetical protein